MDAAGGATDLAVGHVVLAQHYKMCSSYSTGNHLSYLFAAGLLATHVLNATFSLQCDDNEARGTVQSLFSKPGRFWFWNSNDSLKNPTTHVNASDLCHACPTWPHECAENVARLQYALPMMRRGLRLSVPPLDLDDAVLHFRGGDILNEAGNDHAGFPRNSFYKRVFASPKSIGIVTSPWEISQGARDRDMPMMSVTRSVVLDLADYLQDVFPQATVRIRNTGSQLESYARMVHAKQTIVCSGSTFCLYAALAAVNEAYLIDSPLYPFVNLVKEPNFHVVKEPFLKMTEMVSWNKTGEDLAKEIKRWMRS